MTCGWAGRIGYVDLTAGRCWFEPSADALLHEWLGGRGLGVALLQDYTGCDPFAADLPSVLACGPLCGTGTPMASRCVLTGRSPLTGTIFSSASGGPVARQLRSVGLDALVMTGSSATPVMVLVTPECISLEPADELWGLTTDAVFEQLANDAAVAAIGPAGESGVRYASMETSGGEPFARGGLGAVMGHRRLKAIIVKGGDDRTDIFDQAAFDKAFQDVRRLLLASPFLYGPFGIREHGTPALVDLMARRRMLPAGNFTAALAGGALNAYALRNQFPASGYGCFDCPVACKRLADDGLPLPDYDPLAALAGCCPGAALAELVAASRFCSQFGLDPVSAAGSVAAWSELTGRPVDGTQLVPLLGNIARQEGDGVLLGLGAERLAGELGQPSVAMTVKGLELPPYDLRAACGLALACAVAPHGGSHLDAWPLATEVLRKPVPTDPASFDGKARIIALAEDAGAAMDSLALCRFASCAIELEECAALLSAVTGNRYSPADLQAAGGRIVAAERSFNRASGFDEADDRLPERFFSQPAGELPPLDRRRFDEEIACYHRIRAAGQGS